MSPSQRQIDDENRLMQRRQDEFRLAAEYVTRSMSELPAVTKVALFGSVAKPLVMEVPRFREFRRAGIEILHECKDVDIAVWVSDLSCLRALQKARSRALNALLSEKHVGVAHHQVDVFIMDPATDLYRGRLCDRAKCPAMDAEERDLLRKNVVPGLLQAFAIDRPCLMPGCGDRAHLRLHSPEEFRPRRLEKAVRSGTILYDRASGTSAPASGSESATRHRGGQQS